MTPVAAHRCTFCLIVGLLAAPAPPRAAGAGEPTSESLCIRLEETSKPGDLAVQGERILFAPVLSRFYLERGFEPAWTDDERALPAADSLLAAVKDARVEGLLPEHYHLKAISAFLDAMDLESAAGRSLESGRLADLDILCTDAYLLLASHYLCGHVDPESADPAWFVDSNRADLVSVLSKGLAGGRIGDSLRALLPPHSGYSRLRQGLARYRRLAEAGGWPMLEEGESLKKGASGARVVALRERLRVEGDGPADAVAQDSTQFDVSLAAAVRGYQARNGLFADGTVGPATLAALNRPVSSAIEQIIVNLERWRWVPHELGRRHVLVNIAGFRLGLFEDGLCVKDMAVIVGRPFRYTPVFSAKMTYLIFHPSWEVPHELAIKDKLPLIKKDPEYLKKEGFEVLRGWGAEEQQFNPDSLDWSRYSKSNFPFRLRQKAGPRNALGKVKFMFPNKFNVYLHDTPERGLFGKPVRAFSSGCIRVQDPQALAAFLLKSDPGWTDGAIKAAMNSGQERTVRFSPAVPVHLLYWTAWCDEDGRMQFRRDVYERDWLVELALRKAPPAPSGRWLEGEKLGLGENKQ